MAAPVVSVASSLKNQNKDVYDAIPAGFKTINADGKYTFMKKDGGAYDLYSKPRGIGDKDKATALMQT